MSTRAGPAAPGQSGGSPGGELVSVIVSTIRDVEEDLDPAVIEAAVTRVGARRARLRQLARALADRPEILTDGRSPAPLCVGDLLIALRKAGATRISAPACAACGREVSSAQPVGQGWCCPGCKREQVLAECAGCGKTKTVNTRGPDGRAYCWSCSRKDAADPVGDILAAVTAIDPGLPADVVTAAAVGAAPGPMALRKLAWAVRDRPGLLTGDGASTTVL